MICPTGYGLTRFLFPVVPELCDIVHPALCLGTAGRKVLPCEAECRKTSALIERFSAFLFPLFCRFIQLACFIPQVFRAGRIVVQDCAADRCCSRYRTNAKRNRI